MYRRSRLLSICMTKPNIVRVGGKTKSIPFPGTRFTSRYEVSLGIAGRLVTSLLGYNSRAVLEYTIWAASRLLFWTAKGEEPIEIPSKASPFQL